VLSLLFEEVKDLQDATEELRDEQKLLANEIAALQQQTARDRDREARATSQLLCTDHELLSRSARSFFFPSATAQIQQELFGSDTDFFQTSMLGHSYSSPPASPSISSSYLYPLSSRFFNSNSSSSNNNALIPHHNNNTEIARSPFSSTVPLSPSRREILNYLPFLSPYLVSFPEAPFAIKDLSKPFAAVRRVAGVPGEWETSPPIFVFANEAFCDMVQYPLVIPPLPSSFLLFPSSLSPLPE